MTQFGQSDFDVLVVLCFSIYACITQWPVFHCCAPQQTKLFTHLKQISGIFFKAYLYLCLSLRYWLLPNSPQHSTCGYDTEWRGVVVLVHQQLRKVFQPDMILLLRPENDIHMQVNSPRLWARLSTVQEPHPSSAPQIAAWSAETDECTVHKWHHALSHYDNRPKL